MRSRFLLCFSVLLVAAGCVAGWLLWQSQREDQTGVTNLSYKGKSLDAWFYGDRTNFLSQSTRETAQASLDAVGTNAFPFLLHKLSDPRGSPSVLVRVWSLLPNPIRRRFRSPLSGDDIRGITLGHLWKYPARLSPPQVRALGNVLVRIKNPRLRMNALTFLKVKYGAEPEFRKLCERLLEDPARPIRIEAAIPLAEAAIVANPGEPRLALTLLPAFEETSMREEYVELNSYTYNQYPPGSSSRPVRKIPGIATRVEQAEWLKRRIEVALIRLEPFLTPEQLARFTSDRKQTSNR